MSAQDDQDSDNGHIDRDEVEASYEFDDDGDERMETDSEGDEDEAQIHEDGEPVEGTMDETMMEFKDDSVQGFFAHQSPIYATAVHPSQPFALTGGHDDRAFLWHVKTGEPVFNSFENIFKDSVSAVGFSTDGVYAAAGSLAGELAVWNVGSGERVHLLEGPEDITWFEWHPKGSVLLAGSEDGSAWLWSLPSGTCLAVLGDHASPVTAGGFTPDGKQVVTVTEDGTLRIWNPKTATVQIKYVGQSDARFHSGAIHSLALSHDSQLALTGSMDASVKVSHLHSKKIIGSLDAHGDSVETIAISDVQPNIVMTGGLDGKLNIWDLTLLKLRESCEHPDVITKCEFLPGTPLTVTSSVDGLVRVWDSRSGKSERIFHGHQDAVLDFACNSDTIVTGSDDGTSLVFSMSM